MTADTRVDVAIQGIRLLDAPVARCAGAGPSDDGHVLLDGVGLEGVGLEGTGREGTGAGVSAADVLAAGERLRAAVHDLALPHPARPDGSGVVTVSVGAALGPWNSAFAAADDAVYAAKSDGRDRVSSALQALP